MEVQSRRPLRRSWFTFKTYFVTRLQTSAVKFLERF